MFFDNTLHNTTIWNIINSNVVLAEIHVVLYLELKKEENDSVVKLEFRNKFLDDKEGMMWHLLQPLHNLEVQLDNGRPATEEMAQQISNLNAQMADEINKGKEAEDMVSRTQSLNKKEKLKMEEQVKGLEKNIEKLLISNSKLQNKIEVAKTGGMLGKQKMARQQLLPN